MTPGTLDISRRSLRRLAPLAAGLLALPLAACSRAPKEVQLTLAAVGERYDKSELKVPANSRVTLTIKNNALGPATLHNFVLVQPGTTDAVGVAAASAGLAKDYVPSHYAVIASSALARPRQTVTVSFMAPPAGNYEFVCTTPGHYPVMRGTFIVQ